jgi:hypothetical protein
MISTKYLVAVFFVFFFQFTSAILDEILKQTFAPHRIRSSLCVWYKGDVNTVKYWIIFHLIQGFQHFYIYDDSSSMNLDPHLGSIKKYVTVIPMKNLCDSKTIRIGRQIAAYRNCFVHKNNTNQIIGLIDADEYIWANNYPYELVPDIVNQYDESLLYPCPRFGLFNNISYNPSRSVISQFLYRAPLKAEPYHEPYGTLFNQYKDCNMQCTEPQGTCFQSTFQKALYYMQNLSFDVTNHISIHGVVRKDFHNYTSFPITFNRTMGAGGLACNHYFALDSHTDKIKTHPDFHNKEKKPTFYELYAHSSSIQSFYTSINDSIVHDRFSKLVESILVEISSSK